MIARTSRLACSVSVLSRTSRMLAHQQASNHPARSLTVSASQQKAGTSATQARFPSQVGDTESSVARGTRYEHLCRALMSQMFGMELERTGGAGDRGIDLRGWWQLPPAPTSALALTSVTQPHLRRQRRIRIVAQCKCQDEGGKKMGPALVREMEGVMFRESSAVSVSKAHREVTQATGSVAVDEDDVPLAGIMLSSSGFSKQALLQVRSSNVPLAAMHILAQHHASCAGAERDNSEALVQRCVSIVWNDRFGSPTHGLLEGGMEVRWIRTLSRQKSAAQGSMGRPVIYQAGKPLSLSK